MSVRGEVIQCTIPEYLGRVGTTRSHETGRQREGGLHLYTKALQIQQNAPRPVGAPASFQKLMDKTVESMNLVEMLLYLNNIIVFG